MTRRLAGSFNKANVALSVWVQLTHIEDVVAQWWVGLQALLVHYKTDQLRLTNQARC